MGQRISLRPHCWTLATILSPWSPRTVLGLLPRSVHPERRRSLLEYHPPGTVRPQLLLGDEDRAKLGMWNPSTTEIILSCAYGIVARLFDYVLPGLSSLGTPDSTLWPRVLRGDLVSVSSTDVNLIL